MKKIQLSVTRPAGEEPLPSLYWYKGKRLRNMRGCRWYKASTGFWRPAGGAGVERGRGVGGVR